MPKVSNDGNIWLFDQSDFSIKKYNPTLKEVIFYTPLNNFIQSEEEIYFMREYQNKLFIASENNGVLMFDNMGSYIKNIAIKEDSRKISVLVI